MDGLGSWRRGVKRSKLVWGLMAKAKQATSQESGEEK
jgi:hypothetical protein